MIDRVKPLVAALVLVFSSSSFAGEAAPALGPETTGSTLIIPAETKRLSALYARSLSEGGKVVLWAGGDAPNQMDWLKSAFESRFPGVTLDVTVDLSKFHDLRIDQELAAGGPLTPDVAMLQTTFDFDKWKSRGVLLHYKPVGFAQQKTDYADPDGAYVTAYNNAFVPTYASVLLPREQYPTRYADYLRPEFKNKLVLTYPHDDDAVLYVYDKLEKRYGRDFLEALAAQNPRLLRGTAAPAASVGADSIGSLGNLTGYATSSDTPAGYFIPTSEPFIVWNQRAAIFKAARHPGTAKLLLSFLGSAEFQSSYGGWRARADVGEAPGLPPLESLRNVDVHDFTRWMVHRGRVAALRTHMEQIFGPVVGESPLRDPALMSLLGLTVNDIIALPEPDQPIY
ncbi:ABC transporter substrate-binding protein [Pseudomonas aeruginosa]|uniref:ABC transporter substrate-binding protein n=1 Tax=Pseudomonas aeruginosa TaxID=287 RepID=UPI000F82C6F9|nr:ABC transporter substrate-binding protein [Pseudomonas aeruginosa]MBI7468848.1 ABC transporter substrate-binding protein [Pseudomonas aeruginosa]RTW22438.1 ABC transporter substrate-binding protein [Pseudomonas aeruginosa]